MKLWNVIIIIIGLALGLGVIFTFVPSLYTTEKTIDTIDKANDSIDEFNAGLIIQAVKNAYTNAVYENIGSNPTLEQVKNNFRMDNASWNNDYIIETNNFNCNVEVVDSKLSVTCLDSKSDIGLLR